MPVMEQDLARYFLPLNGYGNFALDVLRRVGRPQYRPERSPCGVRDPVPSSTGDDS